MTARELREEIGIELDTLQTTVNELLALQRDLSERTPTLREKTAAAAFMAQFYNGVENILKRTSRHCGVALPAGETWHVDLFQRFCIPSHRICRCCSTPAWPWLWHPTDASDTLFSTAMDSSSIGIVCPREWPESRVCSCSSSNLSRNT